MGNPAIVTILLQHPGAQTAFPLTRKAVAGGKIVSAA